MKNNIHHIHPSYQVLSDLFDHDTPTSRRVKEHLGLEEFENDRVTRRPKRIPINYFWYFGLFYIISVSVLFLVLTRNTAPSSTPAILSPTIIDEHKNNDAEISLIKEVLENLTLTVDGLSKQQNPKKEQEISPDTFKPFLIKVTSPKAHLRELPSKGSTSLAIVQKDTTLIGLGYQEGWIKTYAPSGKEAWVNSTVISKVEAQK